MFFGRDVCVCCCDGVGCCVEFARARHFVLSYVGLVSPLVLLVKGRWCSGVLQDAILEAVCP